MRTLVLAAAAALLWAAPANVNVAVVSTSGDKADVVRAVQQLRRPGSP